MTDQPRRVPEHVLRAGAAAAASSALVKAVRAAESSATMPDPARGQLWRSCWEDITQLVLVLRVSQAGIAVVAPVTTDPPAADDTSAVLGPDLTVLEQPATVWGGLAVGVPLVVFDLAISDIAATVVDAVERVAAGHRTGVLPAGVSVGAPVMFAFDQAAEVRAELADNLEFLGQAAWAPQGSGSAPRPLRELLQSPPDLPALKDALGLGLPAVIDIVMSRRPVTPVQAAAVAAVTGLTAEQVLSADRGSHRNERGQGDRRPTSPNFYRITTRRRPSRACRTRSDRANDTRRGNDRRCRNGRTSRRYHPLQRRPRPAPVDGSPRFRARDARARSHRRR